MEHLLQAIAAVLAIGNPLSVVPVFSSLTDSMERRERRRAALRASVAVAVILSGAVVGGRWVLHVFGISLDAFRAAGGLVILLMGLEMLQGSPTRVQHVPGIGELEDDAILVPFAMPLVAGPGSITTVMTLAARSADRIEQLFVLIAVGVEALTLLAVLLAADWVNERVSKRVNRIFLRFMGLVLLAIGAQFILTGIRQFFGI